MEKTLKERPFLTGTVQVDAYRAGMVGFAQPLLDQIKWLKRLPESDYRALSLAEAIRVLDDVRQTHFIHTLAVNHNLVMDSYNYGLDLIIQRLIGNNTYSLNITFGEIGTGSTAPALSDTALTAPTNRAAVGFQQDYGTTDAIVQFFFADSQLANQTYNEFGTFIDGTTTIGSGQIFNHALISFDKEAGTDLTVQCDFELANSS